VVRNGSGDVIDPDVGYATTTRRGIRGVEVLSGVVEAEVGAVKADPMKSQLRYILVSERLTFLIPFTVSTTSSVSPEKAIGAARYPTSMHCKRSSSRSSVTHA
jgi:hypothetical protein